MENATEIVHWLEALPPIGIYAVLFAVSYLENVVPPLWGDTLIVLCGSFVGLGVVAFVPTVLVAALGGALGFMTVFAAGRRLGAAIHDPDRLRWIPREPVERAERWLERWSLGVVLANRFLAGARSVIALLAGASHLRAVPVAVVASVSALAWSLLLVWAGAAVGAEWDRVLGWLGVYGKAVTVGLVVVGAVAAVRWRLRANRLRRDRADGL